jgi:hypothetical protein
MTAAGVLQWLDLEIEYLKDKYDKEPSDAGKIILMGTWLHLEVMKEQFASYAMQQLDEDTK